MSLSDYINKTLKKAVYKVLDDRTYFGEIHGLRGVWSRANNLEECRQQLKEVLEDWLVLKVRDREKVPGFVVKIDHRQLVKDD